LLNYLVYQAGMSFTKRDMKLLGGFRCDNFNTGLKECFLRIIIFKLKLIGHAILIPLNGQGPSKLTANYIIFAINNCEYLALYR